MKNISVMTGAAFLALGFWSCDEPKESAVAWGTITADGIEGSQGIDSAEGLSLDSASGYCRYQDNKFSFALGTRLPGQLASSSDYYLIINDIEGPPSPRPYNSNGTPRTDEDRSFGGGTIYAEKNSRDFAQEDMIEGQCRVVLFAEAALGDLTPVAYGKSQFQYLVSIDCTGGLKPLSTEVTPIDINGFSLTLWFDNCEA
jgi:hypothetical protein